MSKGLIKPEPRSAPILLRAFFIDSEEINKIVLLGRGRIIPKRINVRIEHVKHSNCRLDFLERVKRNEEIKRDAKEKGVKAKCKRQVSGQNIGHVQEKKNRSASVCQGYATDTQTRVCP